MTEEDNIYAKREILISALTQITELVIKTSKFDARLPGLKAEQKRIADRLNEVLNREKSE